MAEKYLFIAILCVKMSRVNKALKEGGKKRMKEIVKMGEREL